VLLEKQKYLPNFKGLDIPNEEFLIKCMHCGLCLPTCPTYQLTFRERSSPRGRIRLIKSVAEGNLNLTKIFYDEMYYCLDCQACETACPAGVKYGGLVESARVQVDKSKYNTFIKKNIKKIIFEKIFISNKRIKILARILRFYQVSGLQKIIRYTKILKVVSKKLHNIESLTPPISVNFSDESLPAKLVPAGTVKKKVGFFYGCFMNVMFADINLDTIKVLLENSCEIIIPKDQECCGSMHAHNGDMDTARLLAKKNIEAFKKYELDAIVVNSAGCSAFMKEYSNLLKFNDKYKKDSEVFVRKVKDVLEFLNENDIRLPGKKFHKKVTYHDACHHVHTQKIFDQPREILKKLPGLEFIEMTDSTKCCGSAGIYNILNYEESMQILSDKIKNIKKTNAEIVLLANPGCLAQIRYGMEKEDLKIRAIHPITLLKEYYDYEKD
jgi:glycolate oxidase iron-sulfur subunit